MDLLKIVIDWHKILDGLKTMGEWCLSGSAITGFIILQWKLWLKKWWKKRYEHWKKNSTQQFQSLMDVQKEQITNQEEMKGELKKVTAQLYPNGGSSIFDKVDRMLHNQSIDSGRLDVMLYLDDTPTFKCDMEGNCFFVNVAWLQLLGFNDPQEAYGEGWLRSIHPPEKERVRKEFQEAVKSETQFVSEINKMNVANNSVIPVKMVTKIVRDEKNLPIEIVGQLKLK